MPRLTGRRRGASQEAPSEEGTFLTQDPIGLAGGANLYAYANNNPTSFNDPFGLCPEFLTGRPCSTAAAVAIGSIPVIGDAIEIIGAGLGQDLLTGEEIGGLGIAATVIGTIAGSGKLTRMGVDAASDAASAGRRLLPFGDAERLREVNNTLDRMQSGVRKYAQDGAVFANRQGRLPTQSAGYYREYTVETPGARNRGGRRIVQGRGGETYYTDDHYRTFTRIDPSER